MMSPEMRLGEVPVGLISERNFSLPPLRLQQQSGPAIPPSAATANLRNNLSSLEASKALMEGCVDPPPSYYLPEDTMFRISLKVANCTPDQLPPDLFCRLRSLLLTAHASVIQV